MGARVHPRGLTRRWKGPHRGAEGPTAVAPGPRGAGRHNYGAPGIPRHIGFETCDRPPSYVSEVQCVNLSQFVSC